jgi:hypothetical protein
VTDQTEAFGAASDLWIQSSPYALCQALHVQQPFDPEFLDRLLIKDMGHLSAEEEAWIQKYLALTDRALEPKLRLVIEKYKQRTSTL